MVVCLISVLTLAWSLELRERGSILKALSSKLKARINAFFVLSYFYRARLRKCEVVLAQPIAAPAQAYAPKAHRARFEIYTFKIVIRHFSERMKNVRIKPTFAMQIKF